jgi:hypothetical protein
MDAHREFQALTRKYWQERSGWSPTCDVLSDEELRTDLQWTRAIQAASEPNTREHGVSSVIEGWIASALRMRAFRRDFPQFFPAA